MDNVVASANYRRTDSEALNLSSGGGKAFIVANSRSDVHSPGRTPPKGNETSQEEAALGVSGGFGYGRSEVGYDLMDVNGDGLPDRVSMQGDSLFVRLNLGYRFGEAEFWDDARVNVGLSQEGSLGVSASYSGGSFGASGGVSSTRNKSGAEQTLLDVNGDGLLDRVSSMGPDLSVAFNTGSEFTESVPVPHAVECTDAGLVLTELNKTLSEPPFSEPPFELKVPVWDQTYLCDDSTTSSEGGSVSFTVWLGPVPVTISPSVDFSQTMARQRVAVRDVDGDGFADHILSTGDGSMRVARNETGETNLLESVKRPMGASFDIAYKRRGNTFDEPDPRWVLSKVALKDGHVGDGDHVPDPQHPENYTTSLTTYTYEDGHYDRAEREFYGYGTVRTQERDPAKSDATTSDAAIYRTTTRTYLNDSFFTKGLLKRETVHEKDGSPPSKLYSEVENTYDERDEGTGGSRADRTVFPRLTTTETRFFEGQGSAGKSTRVEYDYDAFGNVSGYRDAGDPGSGDDVSATIEHSDKSPGCLSNYVVAAPIKIVVTGGGRQMRRREATVDCQTGDLKQVRQYLANNTHADTNLDYSANGNLLKATEPPNQTGQRYATTYEYDTEVQTHVTAVTDSFGNRSTASYDLKFGSVLDTIDVNGNKTSYRYDDFGRLTSVTGPYEQGSDPSIRFDYKTKASPPVAITRKLDSFRDPSDTIDTVTFRDGLGRTIQTKNDATLHAGPDSAPRDARVVSGRTVLDFLGRTIKQFYPVEESLGAAKDAFNTAQDTISPTRTEYDVLDRVTRTTFPDDTEARIEYGFGPDRAGQTQFEQVSTDANGVSKKSYRNVRELVTGIAEFNKLPDGTTQKIWTSYQYDPLSSLVGVTDDKTNRTVVAYDDLGRRVMIDNPDAGKTEQRYDLASNLVATVTPNLRPRGKEIKYSYDFNRLTSIAYPRSPKENVTYTYGGQGARDRNGVGRVIKVKDGSGIEERFYGKLGETTKEIKTVADDDRKRNDPPDAYTTQYRYDSFGRLQELKYPDGELLTYRYDSGGLPRAVAGSKGRSSTNTSGASSTTSSVSERSPNSVTG